MELTMPWTETMPSCTADCCRADTDPYRTVRASRLLSKSSHCLPMSRTGMWRLIKIQQSRQERPSEKTVLTAQPRVPRSRTITKKRSPPILTRALMPRKIRGDLESPMARMTAAKKL